MPAAVLADIGQLHGDSRPGGITVQGTQRIYVVDTFGNLLWKPERGAWSRESTPALYPLSSVVGVTPASAWGNPSVFVVTAASTMPLVDSELRQYSYDPSTGTVTARGLGTPAPNALANSPYIVGGYDATTGVNGSVFIGVRTSADGHLWTCRLASGTADCAWEDETCRGGCLDTDPTCSGSPQCHYASPISPIAMISYAPSPSAPNEDAFFAITGTGRLMMYRWWTDHWDSIGFPPLPSNTLVDLASIGAAAEPDGTLDVVVDGWDGVSALDTLHLARGTGSTWGWWQIERPDVGLDNQYDYGPNNIGVEGGAKRIWATDSNGQNLSFCDRPTHVAGERYANCADTFGTGYTNAGLASDQLPGRDTIGPALWATNPNVGPSQVYLVGGLTTAVPPNLYSVTTDASGLPTPTGSITWDNHLSYGRYDASALPMTNAREAAEFAGDEYFGTIVVASGVRSTLNPNVDDIGRPNADTGIWRSTDDGLTWSGPVFPWCASGFTNTCDTEGDQNVAFDAAGTAFVSAAYNETQNDPAAWNSFRSRVQLTRWDDVAGNWTTPADLWFTMNDLPLDGGASTDRPWMAADRTHPGVLFLTWAWTQFHEGTGYEYGRFAYCLGNCAAGSNGGQWCPSIVLPGSHIGCNQNGDPLNRYSSAPGCQVDQAGSGETYVMVGDDAGCQLPPEGYPAMYPSGSTTSIGIRWVLGLNYQACATPTLSAPECIYYVGIPRRAQTRRPGDWDPSDYRRWSASLSASRDRSGVIAVRAQGYRTLNGGLCPDDGTTPCRPETFVAYRVPRDGWYGGDGLSHPFGIRQDQMAIANQDQGLDCSGQTLCQVDHVLASVVTLDSGYLGSARVATSWLDFRDDPTNDVDYNFRTTWITPGGLMESPAWNTPFTPVWAEPSSEFNSTFFGDIDSPVNARLHTHMVHPLAAGLPGDTQPYAQTSSVAAHP